MSSRASGGAFAAWVITAAIVGFAGGAFFGTQAGAEEPRTGPDSSTSASGQPPGSTGGDPTTPAAGGLTLEAGQDTVAANEQIDLSGTLSPPEEGVELQIQRSIDGGDWEDFPVTMKTDADGAYSGWIKTGQAGENRFRMIRADDDSVVSEPVTVTVS